MNLGCELVLSKLDGVRARGSEQWSAKCPAHEDRSPSLSVKSLPDGRILMHCFGGCGVDSVLGAMGLEMEILFPLRKEPGGGHSRPKKIGLISRGQALELLQAESLFVAVAAASVARGEPVSESDKARLLKSAARIAYLQTEAVA